MRLRHLIAFVLALSLAVFMAAGQAQAFDYTGDVYGNATAGEEIDLSTYYGAGEYPRQITVWVAKQGAALGTGDANATLYGQPAKAGSSAWIPLYMVQANATSGAASLTLEGIGNATLPITARIGYDGDESWMFKKLKIVPAVTSTIMDTTDGTLYYVIHGGKP